MYFSYSLKQFIMRNFTILISILLCTPSQGQTIQAYNLDANNVKAFVSDAGNFFENVTNSNPGFEAPIGMNSHVAYSMGFWLMGRDENSQLHGSGQTYSINRDWYPGPLNGPAGGGSGSSVIANVTKAQINSYLADFNDDGFLQMPHDAIINWPAHGDVSLGQDYHLAPFHDSNADGIYDPLDGDYPCIKGDEAVYLILNDIGFNQPNLGPAPMAVELRFMFYSYSEPTVNNNSIFVDLEIVKLGTSTISDVYLGLFLDGDVGNPSDDYFGCDSVSSAMYFYNGDTFDEDPSGLSGFNSNLPSFGVKSLLSDASSIITYENDDPASTLPQIGVEAYNNLKGLDNAGAEIMQNGSPTKFMYSATTNSVNTEGGGGNVNAPSDRRGLMSIPIGVLGFNDRSKHAFVFTYSDASMPGDIFASVETLLQDFTINENKYNSDVSNCDALAGLTDENQEFKDVSVYPVPTRNLLNVEVNGDFEYVIYSLEGRILHSNKATDFELIDLSTYPMGNYLLKISDGNMTVTKRITKY